MWEFTTWVAKELEGYQGEISKDIFKTKLKTQYFGCLRPNSKNLQPNTSAFSRPTALWPFLLMWEFTIWVAKEPEGYQGEISEDIFKTKLKAENFGGQRPNGENLRPNTSAFCRPMALWPFLLTIEMWEFTTKLKAENFGCQRPNSENLRPNTSAFGRPLALWPFLLTIEMWEFTTKSQKATKVRSTGNYFITFLFYNCTG